MPLAPSRVRKTFRYAMYFDGIDDYVDCGNRDTLKMTRSFTICTWVAISVDTYPYYGNRLMGQGDGGWPDNYRFELSGTYVGNTILYVWKSGVYGPYIIISGVDIRGRWVFACGGYDADSGYLFIQVDDIEKKSYIGDITPLDTSANVFWIMAPPKRAKGMIYEVRVYNRALSLEERNAIRIGGDVKNGLVLWLLAHPDNIRDVDGDGILEWIDLSGYNNHGKVYGAVLTKLVKDSVAVSPSKRILSVVR